MFTITVVLRKRPEVSQTEFRRIWRDVYGPMYSEADMKVAFATEIYKEAAKIRESIMRETAVGVHVASVDELATII